MDWINYDKIKYGPVMKFEGDRVYNQVCWFLDCVSECETFNETDKKNYYHIDKGIVMFDHGKRELSLSDKIPHDIYSGLSEILDANVEVNFNGE